MSNKISKKLSRHKSKNKIKHTKKINKINKNLVYPIFTNKCKKNVPINWKRFNSNSTTTSNYNNKLLLEIIETIPKIKYNILEKEVINLSNLTDNDTNQEYAIINNNQNTHNENNQNKNIQQNQTINSFHNLLFTRFSAQDVINEVVNDHQFLIKVSFQFNILNASHKYYNLFIYCSKKDLHKINKSFLNKIMSRILFLNFYLDITKLPNNIILYYSNKKKTLPAKYQKFTTQNVNSAVTDFSNIAIYRKEEMLKSILHELIHFHNIDNPGNTNTLLKELISTHNVASNNPYYLNESITEVLATLFNSAFISRQKSNLSLNTILKHYKSIILNELIHNSIQVSKILKNLGYNNLQSFYKLETIDKINQKSNLLHQESDVFAYYILKMYLLNQLSSFINTFNTANKIIVKKEDANSINNVLKLKSLINKSIHDKDLHRFVNYLIKEGPNDRGLRMTAHILE